MLRQSAQTRRAEPARRQCAVGEAAFGSARGRSSGAALPGSVTGQNTLYIAGSERVARIIATPGVAQQRPPRSKMIFPVVARHGKRTHRVENPTRAAKTIVEHAVPGDHLLRLDRIVRYRDANEIEREDDALIRHPDKGRAQRLCKHWIVGDPSERADILSPLNSPSTDGIPHPPAFAAAVAPLARAASAAETVRPAPSAPPGA